MLKVAFVKRYMFVLKKTTKSFTSILYSHLQNNKFVCRVSCRFSAAFTFHH